jgi:hypothetical protein
MSQLGIFARGLAARIAGAFGGNGGPSRGQRQSRASDEATFSQHELTSENDERELRSRERELRVLMSNWM